MAKLNLHKRKVTEPLPDLAWDAGNSAETIRGYLTLKREHLDRMLAQKMNPGDIIAWRTAAIDKLLVGLFNQTSDVLDSDTGSRHPYAIVAQGGYGRVELCYHSDIDLLFLYSGAQTDRLKSHINKMLYPLWDSGLDLGFAVRSKKECLKFMKDDLTILTSLMDTRLLAGDPKYYSNFKKNFWSYFENAHRRRDFIAKIELAQIERGRKYGGSVFLQEPNTKDGKGGLRDFHHIHWATMVFFGTDDLGVLVRESWVRLDELMNLQRAVEFLWTVRNELHRRTGRKSDRILFEHQAPLADYLGFEDSERILAVEDFMRTYYRHAAECFQLSQKVNHKLEEFSQHPKGLKLKKAKKYDVDEYFEIEDNLISLKGPDAFKANPSNLLRVFRIMQETGATLGKSIKESIRDGIELIDVAFRCDPANTSIFRKMLAEPETFVPPVMAMHELGVLENFLPEYANLMYRAQHDVYHVYTVDVHSILAVGVFGRLLADIYADKYPTPTEVIRAIPKCDLLSFAILYHDIGKGEGSGHVEKGAPLIRNAAKRLGFTPNEVDQIEFLELSHLLMTHLAFRRDLDDPSLILEFAESMGTEENLCLLYILTFCDLKAVSQEALTKWRESLLEYLFLRTRSVLIKRDFSKERIEEIASKLMENVKILAHDEFTEEEISHFFNVMPPRYFLTASAVTILDHLHMIQKFKDVPIIFQRRDFKKEDLNEWTLLTLDTPGLFPKICGVLAANGISISEAYLNTSSDGKHLHIFKVQTAQGTMIKDTKKWNTIEQNIKDLLQGRIVLKNLLGNRLRPSLLGPKTARRFPTNVVIHNDLSPFYTVIDIYAHDRVGLLYNISSALTELGLYVALSKIATKVDQVTDTFYVRDIFGQKIRSEDRIEAVRQTLLEVIDGQAEENKRNS